MWWRKGLLVLLGLESHNLFDRDGRQALLEGLRVERDALRAARRTIALHSAGPP